MTKQSIAKIGILSTSIVLLPALSFAGTYMKESKEVKTVVEKTKESCITGDLGVQVVSQYISRGSVLEDQGVIAQPFINIYFKLYEGEGFINSVTLGLGVWASLHSEKTQAIAGSTTPSWYEFDYTPGITVGFAKNFSLGLTYLEFNYPNDNFGTQRLIQARLGYNDDDLLGKFALHPFIKYEYFIENPDEGMYFEAGITPGLDAGPVRVTFPVIAGFGANDFYEDGGFGYISAGVGVSYPLAFVPECLGSWSVNAGYTYYYLDKGNSLDTFQVPGIRSEDTSEHVFSSGLTVAF